MINSEERIKSLCRRVEELEAENRQMVRALQNFQSMAKRAGPMGSRQWEKFDVVEREINDILETRKEKLHKELRERGGKR